MIKLRDLLAVSRLGLSLRAVDSGLDSWLRWALVVEDFDDIEHLTGGELVLTTGRWHSGAADGDRFACALVQRRVSAMGFAAPPGHSVPRDVLEACERWRLPLAEIPAETSPQEVAESAITLILDRRSAGLTQWVQREQSFTSALGAGGGVSSVLDVLSREHGIRIWLLTPGAVFRPSAQPPPLDADLRTVAEAAARQRDSFAVLLSGHVRASVFPLELQTRRGRPVAHLVCEAADEALSSDVRLIVEQALSFLALELRALRTIRDARRRFGGEFVRRVATGDATSEDLGAWARALGVEPRGHVTCVVVQAPRSANVGIEDFGDALENMADALGMARIVAAGEQEASAFLFADRVHGETERAIDCARLLLEPELDPVGGAIGTSSVIAKDVSDVVRTLLDARQVCLLNILRERDPAPKVDAPDPPLSAVLISGDERARSALYSTVLAPLVSYDEDHGSELIRTLDVFLSACGQWSASAAQLGIHVNTLRYRLARIEKFTGRDLGSMADRVDFFVALRTSESAIASGEPAPMRS